MFAEFDRSVFITAALLFLYLYLLFFGLLLMDLFVY